MNGGKKSPGQDPVYLGYLHTHRILETRARVSWTVAYLVYPARDEISVIARFRCVSAVVLRQPLNREPDGSSRPVAFLAIMTRA